MSLPFIGEIKIFGGNFAPRGWAQCDGGTLPTDQNTALFSLIGTTYGGDAVNFNLPDMRGRAPIHPGQGPGLSNVNLGDSSGVETVTLTEAQVPTHSHALLASSAPGTAHSPVGSVLAQPNAGALYKQSGTLVALDASAIAPAPGGTAHNNMQAYLGLNFIIAIEGVYPPSN